MTQTDIVAEPRPTLAWHVLTMRMLLTTALVLATAPVIAAPRENVCASFVGQAVDPLPIGEVFDMLPAFLPRDAYESTANYEKRLEEAMRSASFGTIVVDRPWGTRPPAYDPDKAEIPLYEGTLGLFRLNFQHVLRLPSDAIPDPFGGIGFEITKEVTSHSSYEANNGFGAKVMVEHSEESIDAIWEGSLKVGESPFLDGSRRGVVMTLSLDPARARDVIKRGGSALVVVPKPPFRQEGSTSRTPTFNLPYSSNENVRVLWADVRCVLIYDGSRNVIAALAVK